MVLCETVCFPLRLIFRTYAWEILIKCTSGLQLSLATSLPHSPRAKCSFASFKLLNIHSLFVQPQRIPALTHGQERAWLQIAYSRCSGRQDNIRFSGESRSYFLECNFPRSMDSQNHNDWKTPTHPHHVR